MRRRMILVLSLTLIGMLGILSATTRFILLRSFTDLEHRYVEKDVEQALNALHADMDALSSTANDWAAWDETYAFAKNRDRAYIEANLSNDVFENLRLNVLLLVDAEGRKVYGKGYDLGAGQAAGWYADDLFAALARRPEFLRHDEAGDGVTGIALLPRAPLLLASRPVTDNTATAPRRGSLLMGRFLGPAEVGRLSARLGLSIVLSSPADLAAPSDVQGAPARLAAAGPILVRPLSGSRVAGYALLPTGEGSPGLVLRVDGPRDIVSQGMQQHHLPRVLALR